MADEGRIHSTITIKLLFEWENHQSLIDIIAQQPHTPLPPRPKLRRNVIDNGNATLFHLPRNPPVECRRIDHDGQIRLASGCFGNEMFVEPVDLWQMAENFCDADDREIL